MNPGEVNPVNLGELTREEADLYQELLYLIRVREIPMRCVVHPLTRQLTGWVMERICCR